MRQCDPVQLASYLQELTDLLFDVHEDIYWMLVGDRRCKVTTTLTDASRPWSR
jgi:hypothetical protein